MKRLFHFLFFIFLILLVEMNPLHAQWVKTSFPQSGWVNSFAVSGNNLFAGASGAGNLGGPGGLYRSTDNGSSWSMLSSFDVFALAVSGTNLFVGTNSGVSLSANNGESWLQVSLGLTNPYVRSFAVSDTNLFAGSLGGVFLSTNNGSSWMAVNNGLPDTFISALAVSGSNVFAGTKMPDCNGVFLSTNSGTSWIASGLAGHCVTAFARAGSKLFAASGSDYTLGDGVFLSTNNGATWIITSLTGVLNDLICVNSNLFAAVDAGSVFLSLNNGTTWTDIGAGVIFDPVKLVVSGGYLLAAISPERGAGIWHRPLSELITSVEKVSTDVPTHFSLDQNYPNPFNPTTTISFSLSTKSVASLKVFDALGREVSVLVSEELPPGTYSQQWNAADLASGVFFYRLQAGSFVETKKLVLLR
jgi:hypothetical protein